MKYFATVVSFLFHPIWFPAYGSIIFFLTTSIYQPADEIKSMWTMLVSVSLVAPTLVYAIIHMFNWIKSPFKIENENRKWMLYGYISILLVIALKITTLDSFPMLYFYMMQLSISCFLVVLLHFFKFIISIFTTLIGGITGFTVFLSIFYQMDLTYLIILWVIISGFVASSRMYLTAQTLLSSLIGWLIGFTSQMMLFLLLNNVHHID